MTQAERDRLVALKKAKKKLITQKQAAEEIGITERQVRRLLRKLRRKGDEAVIHELRGRESNRKLSSEVEQRAITILSDPVYRVGEDGDGSLFHLARQLPIGLSPAQLMDYRLVSFPSQLSQESPHLPLCDADLLGSLLLRDQFLLGLLQGPQPVSLGLGHQQLSFVHPPGWTLSIGHFYFAQIGHYYFAATRRNGSFLTFVFFCAITWLYRGIATWPTCS